MVRSDYVILAINTILLLFLVVVKYDDFARFINGVALFLVGANFGWMLCKRLMCKHLAEIIDLSVLAINKYKQDKKQD